MKSMRRRVVAMLLTLSMLITMFPASMLANGTSTDGIQTWQISKSKTATELDANYQSKVTLSLPAAQEQLESDVVFVLDKSTSADLETKALMMLSDLNTQIKDTGAKVNVGVVIFNKVANRVLELTELNETNMSTIEAAIKSEISNYTNSHAGLLDAQDMLENSDTPDNRKYVVFVCDGLTYMFDKDAKAINSQQSTTGEFGVMAGNDCWGIRHINEGGDNYIPENWSAYLQDVQEHMSAVEQYIQPYDDCKTNQDNCIPRGNTELPTTVDVALYKTYTVFQELAENYNCYAMTADTGSAQQYPWGPDFMQYLQEISGNGDVDFEDIQNDIYYLVDAGSTVKDYMGYDASEDGYNFDLVINDDLSNLYMTIDTLGADGESIKTERLNAISNGSNQYMFGENPDGSYDYELEYHPENDGNEYFTWTTNVPLTNFERVQLHYTVELMNPQTTPGTYGEYDADGDGFDENGGTITKPIYTNENAILTAKDSNETETEETFNKPSVSYTIEDQTPITITPADITIYTGGQGYGGVTDANGEILDNTTSTGLPEPGYQITLTESAINWLQDQLNIESELEPQDLSQYLSFDYNHNDVTRHWDMAYVGVYATDDDGNPTQFVYSLLPSVDSGDESKTIPVRLLFWEDLDHNGELNEGENVIDDDDITMTVDSVSKQYAMTINPGGLDQSKVQAVLKVNDKEKRFNVNIGTGTLTVKSTTNKETSTEIASSQENVNSNVIQAVDNNNVTYYVNDSEVAINNATNRVKLLVDEISNSDEFNATMGNDALDRVEDKFRNDANLFYDTAYMDLVDTENGDTVVTMGDNDSLDIYWPAPDNAAADSDYYIVHYTDMDRSEIDSDVANAETEIIKGQPVTINEHKYIKFNVNSFSPFVLVWNEDTSDGGGSTGGGTTPTPPDLNTEDHFSYVVGYPEDYRTGEPSDNEELWPVKPQGNITRAEVASIFYRLLKDDVRDANTTDVSEFSDVSASDWYGTTVATLSAMDIVRGYEDGTFRPNAPITRAEFAAIATRFFEETGAEYEPGTFDDVTGNEWFANAIADAVELGLIGGYPDGTVRPNNNITRAEACAIVNRTLGRIPHVDHLLPADEMTTWPDNNPSDWFYADMQEATNGHEYEWTTEQGQKVEEWTEILDKDWEDR